MMKTYMTLCAVLWMAAAGLAQAEQSAAEPSSFENYRLIYQRNIFSRTRTAPSSRQSGTATRTETVVLSLYVLRGVAVETQYRLAFIEDAVSGQSKRLTVGDSLLNGTITEIRPDGVVFTKDEQNRTIKVGQEFERIESVVERLVETAATSSDPNMSEQAAGPARSAPATLPQDEDAILRQMMERRRQEMGN